MSIEAINEQLLRAIGVGVALIDLEALSLQFRNDTFVEWFGDNDPDVKLTDLFPELDGQMLLAEMDVGGRFATETSFKLRRRKMTVAMEFNRTSDDGQKIAVLVCQNITRIKELESMIDSYSMMVERNTHEIKREKEQVEKLLLNMMPRAAYEEYKTFGVVSPRVFEPVSVLALDFVGFDEQLSRHEPGVIVSELNDVYSAFDRIGAQFGCQRIRTNGDSYVAVSGVPDPNQDHAISIANSGVRFLRYLAQRNESHPIQWAARIGVATGSVIGSVVGSQNYIYDVFGPAVSNALAYRASADAMSIASDGDFAKLVSGKFQHRPFTESESLGAIMEMPVAGQTAG
ncbi:adenylate/guanylate cyclase domain-containing protein [Aliiroseovarius sp. KMU-50]|uniref:Adenylate/guanylate cyclase domain-containing protein n=1 Tax=Aliiroseovarius salicola TaxID=3009082 RepID=A0ABT4W5M2_9RHOB|nr:adenylate/guanylate cyclase domain-containing protein [Aliiroseovarius sp. KMU-50]MDA5095819.1 adenylate/guanylate cyclase domain-containing protein [Aliiroseovarius sp. KMU-50]